MSANHEYSIDTYDTSGFKPKNDMSDSNGSSTQADSRPTTPD